MRCTVVKPLRAKQSGQVRYAKQAQSLQIVDRRSLLCATVENSTADCRNFDTLPCADCPGCPGCQLIAKQSPPEKPNSEFRIKGLAPGAVCLPQSAWRCEHSLASRRGDVSVHFAARLFLLHCSTEGRGVRAALLLAAPGFILKNKTSARVEN